MTDTTMNGTPPATETTADETQGARQKRAMAAVAGSLKKRYAAERRFKILGILALCFAAACLILLFSTIIGKGIPAFTKTEIAIEVTLFPQDIDPKGNRDPADLALGDYRKPIFEALYNLFPDVEGRRDKRALREIISPGAVFVLREAVVNDPGLVGQRITMHVPMSDDMDQYNKGHISRDTPESERRVTDQQIEWFERLQARGMISTTFNDTFFTAGDSREPELAGIRGALAGSFFTMIVTLVLSFPLAVGAAIYLEEFAPKNRLTDLIEVNINNLAAVPSIVFGLLGLAVFLGFFGMPRSAPLVGGMVLSLMTLPTIIIAARASLKAVPPSIREAALGMGASKVQTVFHHVLPLAMPGILTGTIIGMAQALGETAPLLMIGMVAFVVDIPGSVTDPATVMPVQIYLWSDSPERAFTERTSAAIMVLLSFLILMNALAVVLRKRFERKW
jgi:phosphate transport system permease protein